jgi:hypothetical protein
MTEAKFRGYVRKARQYVTNYDTVRWKIADIAEQACCHHVGGRVDPNNRFTVTRFAEEIGLNRKTLLNWCRNKRNVVDKLTAKSKEKIHTIPYEIIQRVSLRVDNDTPIKEVRRLFREESGIPPERIRFSKYIKNMKSVLFNAVSPTRLALVDVDQLEDMKKIADLISNSLSHEIEFRAKHGKPSDNLDPLRIKKINEAMAEMNL